MPDLDRITTFLRNITDKCGDMTVADSDVECDPFVRLFNIVSLDGSGRIYEVSITDMTEEAAARAKEDDEEERQEEDEFRIT